MQLYGQDVKQVMTVGVVRKKMNHGEQFEWIVDSSGGANAPNEMLHEELARGFYIASEIFLTALPTGRKFFV